MGFGDDFVSSGLEPLGGQVRLVGQNEHHDRYNGGEGILLQLGAESERLFCIARTLQHQTRRERTVYDGVNFLEFIRGLEVKVMSSAKTGKQIRPLSRPRALVHDRPCGHATL